MSHIKVWKQLTHVKQQEAKDESFLSQPRSCSSFKFSKVKFHKQTRYEDTPRSIKDIGVFSVPKIRQKFSNSILNDSKLKSRENSIADILDKQSTQMKLQSQPGKRLELSMRKFLLKIKKIHEDLRKTAESLVQNFEKLKADLQVNLQNVCQHILKMQNNQHTVQTVNQIFQKSFDDIKKTCLLPQFLTQFNGISQFQINPKKKGFQFSPEQKSSLQKSKPRNSIFSPENQPGTSKILNRLDFQENSVERIRPVTQRKIQNRPPHLQKLLFIGPGSSKKIIQNLSKSEQSSRIPQIGLDLIISQMRDILITDT